MGSTGSIGTQTLDIIAERPDLFRASVLTARRNHRLLAEQARRFRPDKVVITDPDAFSPLRSELEGTGIEVECGQEALAYAGCSDNVDIVLAALVGYSGLLPTINAIKSGKTIALANKETLVVGGSIISPLVREHGVELLPVDSEHSAIFQCLAGECSPVRRLIITCSGGALRDVPAEKLADVTPEQALKHPQWSMGAKITIDSATLVNKGFEVIEAHWLFGIGGDRISVLVHPQSIVHSMVEFDDGAIKAQLGTPDMRMPISYALMFPRRASRPQERFSFLDHPMLTFAEPDRAKYPALDIAYDCMRRGGTAACVMNGANEVAVAAFLGGRCRFTDITASIEYALERAAFVASPTLDDYAASNAESRALAEEYLAARR